MVTPFFFFIGVARLQRFGESRQLSDAEVQGLLASCGAGPDAQTVSASMLRRVWAASLLAATPIDAPRRAQSYKYGASVRQTQMQTDLGFLTPAEEKLVPNTAPNPLVVALHHKCLTSDSASSPGSGAAAAPYASPGKPTSPRSYLKKKSSEKRGPAPQPLSTTSPAAVVGDRSGSGVAVRVRLAQTPPPLVEHSDEEEDDYDEGSIERSVSSRGSSPARPRLKLHRWSPTPSEESARTYREAGAQLHSSGSPSGGGARGRGAPPFAAAGSAAAAVLATEGKRDKGALGFGRSLTPPSTKARAFLRKGQGIGGGGGVGADRAGVPRGSSVDRGSDASGSTGGGVGLLRTPEAAARGGSLGRLPGGSSGYGGNGSGGSGGASDSFDPLGLFPNSGGQLDASSSQGSPSRQQHRPAGWQQRSDGPPSGRSNSPPGRPPAGRNLGSLLARAGVPAGPAGEVRPPTRSAGGGAAAKGRPAPAQKSPGQLQQQQQEPSPWQSPPRRVQRFVESSSPTVEESVNETKPKRSATPEGSPPPAEGRLEDSEGAQEPRLSGLDPAAAAATSPRRGRAAAAAAPAAGASSPLAARADSPLRAGSLSRKLDELQEFYQASLGSLSPSSAASDAGRNGGSHPPAAGRSSSRAAHPASAAAARARAAAVGHSRAARAAFDAQQSLQRASSMPPPRSALPALAGAARSHRADDDEVDESAFGDSQEGGGPTVSAAEAAAGLAVEAALMAAVAPRRVIGSSSNSSNNSSSSANKQVAVRHHPRFREFYFMRWRLGVDPLVVAQQMEQIGLDPQASGLVLDLDSGQV
jgi:hypothetical protein